MNGASSILEIEFDLFDIDSVSKTLLSLGNDFEIWFFFGEMGVGKTTLIRSICQEIGVVDMASSPTYSIVNEYQTSQNDSVYHFDFYRIKSESEASDLGVDEYFFSGDLCFVEWPELIPSLWPEKYLKVVLELVDPMRRKISIYQIDTENN